MADRRVLSGVVYIIKRSGPSTDPCGTPQDRGVDEESELLQETTNDLEER